MDVGERRGRIVSVALMCDPSQLNHGLGSTCHGR